MKNNPNNTIHNLRDLEAFARLLNIMDDLHEQCPWDKKTEDTKFTQSYYRRNL